MTQIAQKSMLAKLLASENISFQHDPSAKTAYFDIKRRILVLPVWRNISADLYDLLVVHEVGHALDTPTNAWLKGIKDIVKAVFGKEFPRAEVAVKGFMNVIEDARIDKRQKRRYPGSRRNYVIGYKELIERDFFGTAKLDIQKLPFIDRANIYFKGGFALGIKFDSEERAFIKRMEDAETFAQVLTLTEEIYRWSKDRGEMDRQTRDDHLSYDSDEDGDEFELDFEYDDSDDDEVEDGEGKGKSKDDDEDDDSDLDSEDAGQSGERGQGDINENSNTGARNKSSGAGSSANDDYVPESLTERAWQQNQDNLVVNDNIEYMYVNIPKPVLGNIVDDYKVVLSEMVISLNQKLGVDWMSDANKRLTKFKTEENNSISFMVKEFEMRKQADTYAKISIAKTGVIDTNKLQSYKFNDDIFRRLSTVPNGKNHGFVFILDWSGSMQSLLQKTMKQLFSMIIFCRRVQIPFEVYLFRDFTDVEREKFAENGYDKDYQFLTEENTVKFGQFKLRNVLSSRMNLVDLNKAMLCLYASQGYIPSDPMMGTPLNQAIVAAEGIVNDFRKRNKLEVVNTVILTDGDSNNIEGYGKKTVSYSGKSKKFFIQDNVTKKEYAFKCNIMDAHSELTEVFIKILKERTGSNVIGFYLSKDSMHYIYSRYFPNIRDRAPLGKFWKENKFLPVTTIGYDEYFIISAYDMDINVGQLKIDSRMSNAKVAKEFLRFAENKTTNRVLLGRIIDRVTTNAKVKTLKIG